MALSVEEDILRLQISVNDSIIVEVLKGQNYLSCIESSPFLREPNLITKMVK